jgi:hypothetical protein
MEHIISRTSSNTIITIDPSFDMSVTSLKATVDKVSFLILPPFDKEIAGVAQTFFCSLSEVGLAGPMRGILK